MRSKGKLLIVLTGATGVGKSDISIALAQHFSAPIISCDSRQIYKEMTIGTAVPSLEQLNAVKHYFIQNHSITEHYSVGDYEKEVIELLDNLFITCDVVLLVGGTGLYIDAVCNGIDDIPSVPAEVRDRLKDRVERGELQQLAKELEEKDSEYFSTVDTSNPQRVIRALEVIESTGKTFSSFRRGDKKIRPFNIVKFVLNRERDDLYDRINRRVNIMIADGLIEEAKGLYSHRDCNALQTVGYQEIFSYMDGDISLEEAIELIKRNSRRYAKRQLTWFRRDNGYLWLDVNNNLFNLISEITSHLPISGTH